MKYVLYKINSNTYGLTEQDNYDNIFTDASKIVKISDCVSAKEAIDAIVNYGFCSEDEIIDRTGE